MNEKEYYKLELWRAAKQGIHLTKEDKEKLKRLTKLQVKCEFALKNLNKPTIQEVKIEMKKRHPSHSKILLTILGEKE